MTTTYTSELALATSLARSGGTIARSHQDQGVVPELKAGHEPVTAADRAVNAHIVEALTREFPDDAVLAEESPPDPRRFTAARTWFVDPIDGTREFIAGTDAWEVLIGLVEDGRPVLGVAFNPTSDTLYTASKGGGAWVTREGHTRAVEIPQRSGRAISMAVRRGHFGELPREIAGALGVGEIRKKGAFGARVILAVESEVDVVLHVGGSPKEWDTCALQVVIEEAGGVMLNCLGDPPRYLKKDLVQRHGMVVTARGLAERVMSVVTPLYERHRAEWDSHRPAPETS